MPERQVVRGIDGHPAVISPTVERACLVTTAGDQRRLALPQRIRRIAYQATRIANGRLRRVTRDTVTYRHVSEHIHANAWHPSPKSISPIIKSLLL